MPGAVPAQSGSVAFAPGPRLPDAPVELLASSVTLCAITSVVSAMITSGREPNACTVVGNVLLALPIVIDVPVITHCAVSAAAHSVVLSVSMSCVIVRGMSLACPHASTPRCEAHTGLPVEPSLASPPPIDGGPSIGPASSPVPAWPAA